VRTVPNGGPPIRRYGRQVPALPVSFGTGEHEESVLDPEPPGVREAIDAALESPAGGRRDALAAVVARWPASLEAWARLGDAARDPVEAYACYRVAYHRGLDRLRQVGWRGSGSVRWSHPENRGFLRAVDGLGRAAAALGETDEVQRTGLFLRQLEPDWDKTGPQRDQ